MKNTLYSPLSAATGKILAALLLPSFLAALFCLPVLATAEEATAPAPAQATVRESSRQDQVITAYQQHRLQFLTARKNISAEVQAERGKLDREIARLAAELERGKRSLAATSRLGRAEIPAGLQNQLRRTRQQIDKWDSVLSILPYIQGAVAVFLAPWSVIAGPFTDKIFLCILPIMALNIVLFLFYRHRDVFTRHKKWLIICLVAAILASATSLMAAPVDKRLQVETSLRYAEDMLTLSGNAKAIRILEGKAGKKFILPDGIQGCSGLNLYNNVELNSPEYFMTLASLYCAGHQDGKAIEALSAIAEKKGLEGTPDTDSIIKTIHYLVDKGYTDVAGTAVKNHAASIRNTETLLELSDYLRAHTMQVSADAVMATVLKNTSTTSGLVYLANYYQKAGKIDKAGELLAKALKKARSIQDIIAVARGCGTIQADDIWKNIPARAKRLSGSPEDLVNLARLFRKHGASEQVAANLGRAIDEVKDMYGLQAVVKAAIELHQEDVLDKAGDKALSLFQDLRRNFRDKRFQQAYNGALDYIDFLLSLERREDATGFFKNMTRKIQKNHRVDDEYIGHMIELSRAALQRDMKKQAEEIVFKLAVRDIRPRTRAFSTYIGLPEETPLDSIHGLPDPSRVAVPLYQGLLDEEINQLSKAEQAYMQSVIFSLDAINNSYGDKLPRSLNDYYLLGRLWQKENRTEVLASLDRVYTLLEKRILERLRKKERQQTFQEPLARLARLKQERQIQIAQIEELKEKAAQRKERLAAQRRQMTDEAYQELERAKSRLSEQMAKALLKSAATLVLLVILLAILFGCLRLAYLYSQRLQEHRLYGFVSRFAELNGWVRVFSVLGLPSGLTLVLASQFFQIFQKIHELTLQQVPRAGYFPVEQKVSSRAATSPPTPTCQVEEEGKDGR